MNQDWLEVYAEVLKRTEADIVRIGKVHQKNYNYKILKDNELKTWVWCELAQNGYNWKYTVKREIAIRARFPEEMSYCEDSLYSMPLIPYIHKAVQLTTSHYNYRDRVDSAMKQSYKSQEKVLFIKKIRNICLSQVDYNKKLIHDFDILKLINKFCNIIAEKTENIK